MNHLLRTLAPISDSSWELLDQEARSRLTAVLAARKLVDFSGPHGWEHSATNLGRTTTVEPALVDGLTAMQRKVLPLIELRADFAIRLSELRDHDRAARTRISVSSTKPRIESQSQRASSSSTAGPRSA